MNFQNFPHELTLRMPSMCSSSYMLSSWILYRNKSYLTLLDLYLFNKHIYLLETKRLSALYKESVCTAQ
jgi:hypothetical protein